MNSQEILQLLDKLNAIGAKYFKSGDFEVSRDWAGHKDPNVIPSEPAAAQPEPRQPHSQENTQKVQELIDLLKMKDEELVNKIFPAGA